MRRALLAAVWLAAAMPERARAQDADFVPEAFRDRDAPAAPAAPAAECDPESLTCVYTAGERAAESRTRIGRPFLDEVILASSDVTELAGLAPGGLPDDFGVGFGGATSFENRHLLDGFQVGSVRFGGGGLELAPELARAVEVRRAGLAAAERGAAGAVIAVELRRGSDQREHGAFVRGGLLPRPRGVRPWFPSTIRADVASPPRYELGLTSAGPVVPGRVWYFAGVVPRLERLRTERVVGSRVDRNEDGRADVDATGAIVLEEIERRTLAGTAFAVPIAGRLDARVAPGHEAWLSSITELARAPRYRVDGAPPTWERRDQAFEANVVAGWRSSFDRDRTVFELTGGWHRRHHQVRSPDGALNDTPEAVGLFEDDFLNHESEAVRAACGAGDDDPYPLITNCPVSFEYATGGVGALVDDREQRLGAAARVTQRIDAGGIHRVAAGAEVTGETLARTLAFSGGSRLNGSVVERYVELTADGTERCGGQPCRSAQSTAIRSSSREIGLFVQDSWSPRPDLTIGAGVRWEVDALGGRAETRALAPRLSVAYDPTAAGRARVFATAGRYVQVLPLSFADRAFADYALMRGDTLIDVAPLAVATELAPYRTDELSAGADYAIADQLRVGIGFQQRRVASIIEDQGDSVVLVIGNPAAERDYRALTLTIATDPRKRLSARLSYSYARLRGDYPGFYAAETGQVEAGLLEAFDDVDRTLNTYGTLAAERPHALRLDGAYHADLGVDHDLVVGFRMRALSGRPASVLGRGGVFILPRGEAGRTHVLTTTDVRLAWRTSLPGGSALELGVDVFNVFNRDEVLRREDRYTNDQVRPIVGGGPEDLPYLKTLDAGGRETDRVAARNPAYGAPVLRQAGPGARLGLQVTF